MKNPSIFALMQPNEIHQNPTKRQYYQLMNPHAFVLKLICSGSACRNHQPVMSDNY